MVFGFCLFVVLFVLFLIDDYDDDDDEDNKNNNFLDNIIKLILTVFYAINLFTEINLRFLPVTSAVSNN